LLLSEHSLALDVLSLIQSQRIYAREQTEAPERNQAIFGLPLCAEDATITSIKLVKWLSGAILIRQKRFALVYTQ
jgi:hypothetical protein